MALAIGTNSGFCAAAPVDDPGGTSDVNIDNYARTQQDTSPGTGYAVTTARWWCDNATEAADFEVGIYSNDATATPDAPNAKLAGSAATAKGTDAGWKSASVAWDCQDGLFWVAAQCDNVVTTTYTDRAGVAGVSALSASGRTTLDDSWAVGSSTDNRIISVCAVYEAAGGRTALITRAKPLGVGAGMNFGVQY